MVVKLSVKGNQKLYFLLCSGVMLDSFARASLWRTGLDYLHGTGHGVGSFLNVHEGEFTGRQTNSTLRMTNSACCIRANC